jgi:hypothetical protein
MVHSFLNAQDAMQGMQGSLGLLLIAGQVEDFLFVCGDEFSFE